MKIYLNGQWQDLPLKITASAFSGATSTAGGAKGLVPAPSAGEEGKFLCANGSWMDASSATEATDDEIISAVSEVLG